jgi:hypothetical protein
VPICASRLTFGNMLEQLGDRLRKLERAGLIESKTGLVAVHEVAQGFHDLVRSFNKFFEKIAAQQHC